MNVKDESIRISRYDEDNNNNSNEMVQCFSAASRVTINFSESIPVSVDYL